MKSINKIRIIIFAVIMITLAYFATGYLYELHQSDIENFLVDINTMDTIKIDGSDFTFAFKLLGYSTNSLIFLVSNGLYMLIIFAVSLILLIPFRIIGLNKKKHIDKTECKIMTYMFIAILSLSVLTGCILTKGSLMISLLLFNSIWAICVFLLCILSLRNRFKQHLFYEKQKISDR